MRSLSLGNLDFQQFLQHGDESGEISSLFRFCSPPHGDESGGWGLAGGGRSGRVSDGSSLGGWAEAVLSARWKNPGPVACNSTTQFAGIASDRRDPQVQRSFTGTATGDA